MQHALIRFIGNRAFRQLPLARTRLRRQNVTSHCMPPGNLARTGLLETLGRTLVGFHLGHNSVLILFELGIPLGSVAATKTLKRLTGASQPAEQRLNYSMPSHPGPVYQVRVIHSFVSPNLSRSNENAV
jgi:hypothetical protein